MSDIYTNQGERWGRVDSNGEIYSSDGTYMGRIYENGKIYDSHGGYLGSINTQGKIYDAHGNYQGSINNSGQLYDESGSYQGSIWNYENRFHKGEPKKDSKKERTQSNPRENRNHTFRKSTNVNIPSDGGWMSEGLIGGVFVVLFFAAFMILSDCYHVLGNLLISPFSCILLILSMMTVIIADKKQKLTKKSFFIMNYIFCLIWSVIYILVQNSSDGFMYRFFIMAICSVAFAGIMTLISGFFYKRIKNKWTETLKKHLFTGFSVSIVGLITIFLCTGMLQEDSYTYGQGLFNDVKISDYNSDSDQTWVTASYDDSPGNQENSDEIYDDTEDYEEEPEDINNNDNLKEHYIFYDEAAMGDYELCTNLDNYVYKSSPQGDYSFYYPEGFYNIMGSQFGDDLYLEMEEETALDSVLFLREENEDIIDAVDALNNNMDSWSEDLDSKEILLQEDSVQEDGLVHGVVCGSTPENGNLYVALSSNEEYTYCMAIYSRHSSGKEENRQINYYIECMYRYCSFTRSTKSPRTYEQFLNSEDN